MSLNTPGIHHITAIAGNPQQNLDFYTGLLGLRLVKLTVNFDDPDSYHLYYGDEVGSPGTIMTFFSWPGAPRGRIGSGETSVTAFSVPAASLDFWRERLCQVGVAITGTTHRFEEDVLSFTDPDGLQLELVASATPDNRPVWAKGSVPTEHAIRGFFNATLNEQSTEATANLLTQHMGFRLVAQDGNRSRYESGQGGPGSIVDVVSQPDTPKGRMGFGTVHHIAYRANDDAEQLVWQKEMTDLGLSVSPVMDREYFHSIYYREPGGVLFELATDAPGFVVDEPMDELGSQLKLPSWFEAQREIIEARVLPLRLPNGRQYGQQ
jgi:catechol 2,3-dioxygenase-like lactoylglutathione lyase family enzyme